MRGRLVGVVGIGVLVTAGAAVHAGELERLRGQVSAPRAPATSDNSGPAAALEQRANEAVTVSPAADPARPSSRPRRAGWKACRVVDHVTGSPGRPSVPVVRVVPTLRWS